MKVKPYNKEFDELVRLIELDNDEGKPLYKDGDRRIGFKEKDIKSFHQKRKESCLDEINKVSGKIFVEKDLVIDLIKKWL